MGKKSSSAPKPPDPMQTAAAQTGTNISTAVANGLLQNYNQVTPDGSLTFKTDGYETITDGATGKQYQVPIRTAVQELSGQQQAIKDQSDAAELNLASLANQQSGFLQDYMAAPVDLNNEAVESRLYDLGSKRIDPRFAQQREALETRLANQGIGYGTEAYDRAMGNLGQQENDAYNQLLLTGRQQAVQEALTERNQPINEITALLSGSQVSQPNFVSASGSPAATTDYAGLVNSNYQNRLANWQQNQNSQNAMTGAMLGLGANLISLSDRRAKKDIKKVGSVRGMKLYEYRYKGQDKSEPKQIGLMAQEVEKARPEAVVKRPDGLLAVNYTEALK